MWPKYLDMNSQTCSGILRRLELEAYSSVVTALRAQGDLTKERRKVLQDLSNVLNVPVERHKAEIRRAVNDELLGTIAATVSGPNSENEWAREGRRIIPLLRRATPINAFSPLANKTKSDVENYNRMLKSPMDTRTPKRAKLRASLTTGDERQHSTDLADMIYTTDNGDVRVKPPQVSISPLPQKFKALQEFFGGDCEVVILPSGGAVRIKNTPIINDFEKEAEKKLGGRRKRKQSEVVGAATDQLASTPVKTTPAPPYEVFPPGWQLKSPSRPLPPPPQPATPAQVGTPFYGMPPPSGPVGRKETPRGGGRGGRRGQGTTPRSRKPRSSNKLKAAFPIATTEAAFQQQQLIIQQHQQQQQQQHGYAKPVSIPGMLSNSSPTAGSTQYEALNLVTSMSNNTGIPQSPTSINSASAITAPKVVVVSSSSSSPLTSGTIVSTVNTKPTTTPVSSAQVTQILRQNLMSVSVPTSVAMSSYAGTLRMPNIPQMISAAFANGAAASNSNNVPPKTSQANNTIPTSTAVTSQQSVAGGNTPSRQAANAQQANAVKLKPEDGQMQQQQQQQHQLQQNQQQQQPGTLKVIPPGTRILPKPGTPMGCPPVYMVAAGQNVMRIARPVMDEMTGTVSSSAVKLVSAARMITTSGASVAGATIGFGPQRVVTVNAAALRPTLSAVRPVAVSMANSPGLARMVQPRVLPTAGGIPRPGAPDKPSVIVVQKGPGGKAVYTKDGSIGHRIMQQQQQQQAKGGISKPIVIMSKPSSAMSSAASASSDAYSSSSSTQQGNVIVLDLSQEHQMASSNSSTTLSDLLQASGIMTSENEGNSDSGSSVGSAACRVGGGQHENLMEGLNHRQPQQVLLQQRIPAEKLSHDAPMPTWSHTNSVMTHRESQQHSATPEINKFQDQRNLRKQDIFSRAVASAEIEEFATDTETF